MTIVPRPRSQRLDEAHPGDLVDLMAAAAYEAYRTRAGRHLPAWEECSEFYRAQTCDEVRAALTAAVAAGYRFIRS